MVVSGFFCYYGSRYYGPPYLKTTTTTTKISWLPSCAPNSYNATKAAQVCPQNSLCTSWCPQTRLSPALSSTPQAVTWKGRVREQRGLLWMRSLGRARGGTHELRPGGRDSRRGNSTQRDPTSGDPNAGKRKSTVV